MARHKETPPHYVCSCRESACRESCPLYKGRQEGLKYFREERAKRKKEKAKKAEEGKQ